LKAQEWIQPLRMGAKMHVLQSSTCILPLTVHLNYCEYLIKLHFNFLFFKRLYIKNIEYEYLLEYKFFLGYLDEKYFSHLKDV